MKILLDGTYVRYVKPGLFPYLLAAAIVIIVLGIAAIVRDVRRGHADTDEGHRHTTQPYWLLLIPAAVILFAAPPALGASSVGSSASQEVMTAPGKTAFPPIPDGAAPQMPLLEVIQRSVRDSTGSLDGRQITVSGFVIATSNGGAARIDGGRDSLDLARY
ncbi:TIGR03943 family putative permease subunit [Rhodococcus opacus]|uniref:TIGR03943 family putative permease subunit n=1 Tax=Rhodococcus opacus TaxID=37919 RepID=UPI000B29A610|nr:TIGR03943 family protein [Rhodococcus opacus]